MDNITILRHQRNPLAKQWNADNTISQYGDAKFFTHKTAEVHDLAGLSGLLTKLAPDRKACLIRGAYVGDEAAKQRDPEFVGGKVRRALDYFDDQALHAVMLDVDRFVPFTTDVQADPEGAIAEYVQTMLPKAFHGAGVHWHLSNSAGHQTKLDGKLRVHLWFWLQTPQTSAALKAWATSTGVEVDLALFNPVQIHYTSDPVMAAGVTDPIRCRWGFVGGPPVALEIDAAMVAAGTAKKGRGERLRDVAAADPIAQVLAERGMIKSQVRDGFNIECPFEDGHTPGSGGETSTQYMLPNTGGFALGHFKCLHASCASRTRQDYLAKLGINEAADDFGVLEQPTDAGDTKASKKPAAPLGVPAAQHLCTDQANAERLIQHYGKRLIVVAGEWLAWQGDKWLRSEKHVHQFAMKLSKHIKAEANGWLAKTAKDPEEAKQNAAIAKALMAWSVKSESAATIKAAIGLAKKVMAPDTVQLDRDDWLLNCLNGTVDLRTGVLKDHDPEDYITRILPLEYDPNAKCPVWEAVLLKVTCEVDQPRAPVAAFLHRWFGYCCTGSTREQVFVVHYGGGANGKSTVLDAVASVLGDYAGTAAPGMLVSSGKDRHPTEIADLCGRRMMTAHETADGGMLREEFIKQATGSDRLKGRLMRANFSEFEPTHKLQLLTNHKPVIKGQDHGIWRRVVLVPYTARWGSAEEVAAGAATYVREDRIAERLEAEKQGILAWLVRGAAEWYETGLRAPDTVMAASRDYRAEQDRMAQFIAECCEVGPGHEVILADDFGGLYPAYREWCQEAGSYALAKKRMFEEVQRVVPAVRKEERKVQSAEKRKTRVFLVGMGLLA